MNDVIDFIKEKKGGVVVKSFNWQGALRFRACAFVAMLKGYFSPGEFFQILLPSSFSPQKLSLLHKYNDFLCKELQKDYPSSDGLVDLFGHRFGGGNYYEIFELVNDVIVRDQYYAKELLKKDFTIIDAGANIGTFSVFAAHLVPQGKVYSFEPVKGTYEALKRNAKDYQNLTPVNAGLGSEVARKKILVDSEYTTRNVFEDSPFYDTISGSGEGKKFEETDILTIDSFTKEHNIGKVDYIKIDTEGYETRVLEGAREVIAKWKPIIGVSAYHNPKDKEDIPRILKEISPDYICQLHTNDREEDFICYVKK